MFLLLFRLFLRLPQSLLLQLFQPGTGFGHNGTALRSQRNARMALGAFKSFSFQEQGQIEIDKIPAARTWDRIGHIVIFLKVCFFRFCFRLLDGNGSTDSFLIKFHNGKQSARKGLRGGLHGHFQSFYGRSLPVPLSSVQTAAIQGFFAQDIGRSVGRIAVGRSDVDGKIDMGLSYGQGVDGKQVDKGHLEGHGFALCSSHLNTHGDHLRFVDPVLVFETVLQQEGGLSGQHHHVGLGKGNQRSADNALDVLFAVQMFRFRHNLETNGNVDEEKQPTGKPIQMLNSNTPDYQKTRYHD